MPRIYVYGDYNAAASFANPTMELLTTMRMTNRFASRKSASEVISTGRVHNYAPGAHEPSSIAIFNYGELDCYDVTVPDGQTEDSVLATLASQYLSAIATLTASTSHIRIFIVAVLPPYKSNGVFTLFGEALPFSTQDADRLRWVTKFNTALASECTARAQAGFVFFDPYAEYRDADGYLETSLSDGAIHIGYSCHVIAALWAATSQL